jgi:guanylate kinase
MKNNVLFIVGPSGSGKSTLERELLSNWPEKFSKVRSATTRPKRTWEIDGDDYFFVDEEEFKNMEMTNYFAEVDEFGGNSYGALLEDFKDPRIKVMVSTPMGIYKASETLIKAYGEDGYRDAVVYFDITERQRIYNMRMRGDFEHEIEKRLKIDTIAKDFQDLEIIPTYIVCNADLNNDLPKIIMNEIEEYFK